MRMIFLLRYRCSNCHSPFHGPFRITKESAYLGRFRRVFGIFDGKGTLWTSSLTLLWNCTLSGDPWFLLFRLFPCRQLSGLDTCDFLFDCLNAYRVRNQFVCCIWRGLYYIHLIRSWTHFYSAPQCPHCKRCTSYSNDVCLSVCPSVTRWYCVKTTARSTVQNVSSFVETKKYSPGTTPYPWNLGSKWPTPSW